MPARRRPRQPWRLPSRRAISRLRLGRRIPPCGAGAPESCQAVCRIACERSDARPPCRSPPGSARQLPPRARCAATSMHVGCGARRQRRCRNVSRQSSHGVGIDRIDGLYRLARDERYTQLVPIRHEHGLCALRRTGLGARPRRARGGAATLCRADAGVPTSKRRSPPCTANARGAPRSTRRPQGRGPEPQRCRRTRPAVNSSSSSWLTRAKPRKSVGVC